jgi:hypothetical protein
MRAIRIIAILSVIGFTMGAKHSLKQKLAERGNTLAEVEAETLTGAEQDAAAAGFRRPCDCGCDRFKCPVLDNSCCKDLKPKDCNCKPDCVGGDFPCLGNGTWNPTLMKTVLSANQEEVFEATPDTTFTALDESACCSCENALHQAGANATKVRRFGIRGDICVTENIQFVENGCAEEASVGRSKKNSIHQENTVIGCITRDNCTDFGVQICSPLNVTSKAAGIINGVPKKCLCN